MIVAISPKALKLLESTELGKLIASGKKLEGDAYEIMVEPDTAQKIETAKTRDGAKHHALADRLIACLSKPAAEAETETPALDVR
jgi:hypothetical protein